MADNKITRAIRIFAFAAFVVMTPLFLITANASLVIDTPLLYNYGFNRYQDQIRYYLQISDEELHSAGQQIRDYFNDDEDLLVVRVIVGGARVDNLYNTREVAHMKDVKGLVQWVDRIWKISGLYLLGFVLVALISRNERNLPRLNMLTVVGGGLTLVLVALVGLGVSAGFDRLFLAFHEISFNNDFWMLDPTRDALIAMFPQGFFFDATILIVGATIVEAMILVVVPRILVKRTVHNTTISRSSS
ncbi:TIGR01906 family membrane protein [Dehalococcoidia bacterium]|nr:TIGR01906 family membrane protein [Dehalococcoidia bacterium]